MGLRSKSVSAVGLFAGLALFSQAPEFAQQYRQRIGGAVDELKVVVADFDRDAAASQMTRDEALGKLAASQDPFARDRGRSMTGTLNRFERLRRQQSWLEGADAFTRPLFVLRNPDRHVLTGAWEIFEPAVPLTIAGLAYGGAGGLLFLGFTRAGIAANRRRKRRKTDRKLQAQIERERAGGAKAEKAAGENPSALAQPSAAQPPNAPAGRSWPGEAAVVPGEVPQRRIAKVLGATPTDGIRVSDKNDGR